MKDYHSTHMVTYEEPKSYSFSSIPVLEFLNGRKWDDIALAYVHAVRPSSIRVTKGSVKTDARTWRVTVFVNDNDVIEKITQEVQVGIPEGVESGHHLEQVLKGKAERYTSEEPVKKNHSYFGLDCEDTLAKDLIQELEKSKKENT